MSRIARRGAATSDRWCGVCYAVICIGLATPFDRSGDLVIRFDVGRIVIPWSSGGSAPTQIAARTGASVHSAVSVTSEVDE
jgi:hypothetical protein